jgi:hypothetical protein
MLRRNKMKRLITKLSVIAVVMFAATSAFADYSYTFDVNTSSLAGQAGYIDLEYNQGALPTGASSAVVSNYTSNATLVGSAQLSGGATGQLPSNVTINNSTGFNDYYQQITYGTYTDITIDLSGATAGNSFALSFYGSDGSTPELTSDVVNGYATVINGTSNGTVLVNNSSEVTVAQTPIPAAAWLLGSGLIGMLGIRRRMINS